MPVNASVLQVYAAGKLTVVGFGGRNLLDQVNLSDCRTEVLDLVRENDCEVLAFDLTGVAVIPSGLLGLLASLRQRSIEIHLYNPSESVRDVLEVTKLNQLMPVHEIEL